MAERCSRPIGAALSSWDVATGHERGSSWTHQGLPRTQCVAVFPDGKTLVTGSGGAIQLWDAATGDERATLRGHASDVSSVAVSPDGKTVGTTSWDGTAKLWPSASEQDVLDESSIFDFREGLAISYTRWARSLEQSHKYEEAEKTYGQALTYYQQLLADFPNQADYWSETGEVFFGLRQWEQAADHYSKAIELAPEDAATWNKRAVAASALGQHDRAIVDLSQAIALQPDASLYWSNRAHEYVRLGQGDKAAHDYAKSVQLNSNRIEVWQGHALACVAAGDLVGYRQACGEILDRFADVYQPEQTCDAVWSCVQAPASVADYTQVVQLANEVAKSQPGDFVALSTLGAAQYRAGEFEPAIQRLVEAQAAYTPANEVRQPLASNWFFLAMAHQRLGHVAEAKLWLDKAVESTDNELATAQALDVDRDLAGNGRSGQSPDTISDPLDWTHRVALATLRREADTLLSDQTSSLGELPRKANPEPLVRQTPAARYVKLVHVATGKVLAVEHDSAVAEAWIVLAENQMNNARQWKFEQDGDYYKVVNRHSGKVLDVFHHSYDVGAAIIQYDEKPLDNDNQRWSWIGQEEGQEKARRLQVKSSGLVLDTDDNGKVIQRQADEQAKSQLWQVIEVPERNPP